jgi:peptide/nickel transport system substrate-binding protein
MNMTSTAGIRAMKLNYEPLVRIGLDGEPRPGAATDWNVEDDTTIHVTLREDMTFHDGEPVTAEDVQFTYDYMNEWGVPALSTYYEPVDSVEIINDTEVRFHLTEPYSGFIRLGMNMIWILPMHIWDGIVEERDFEHPRDWTKTEVDTTGSGPFEITFYEPNSRAVYERHDDHHMDFEMDTLVWSVYGSLSAAMGDLESGDIHHVKELQPEQYERAEDNDNLVAVANPSHGYVPVHIHNEHVPFHDPVVRRAMAHALDKQEIINVALSGYGDVSISPIAPANEFYHNSDVPAYEGGPEEARQLLIDAGYRWDENGNLLVPQDRMPE